MEMPPWEGCGKGVGWEEGVLEDEFHAHSGIFLAGGIHKVMVYEAVALGG